MAEDIKPAAKKPAASKHAAKAAPAKAAAPKAAARRLLARRLPPKAAAPKAAAPKAAAPKAAAPKAAGPKAAAPKAAAVEASAPKAAKPAVKPAKKKPAVAPGPKVDSLRMHHLRPAKGAHTPKTRVGRGEGSKGKTAGRGTKGTGARYQVSPRVRGRTDADPHAHPEAPRLPEPVQDHLPGGERRSTRASSTPRAAPSRRWTWSTKGAVRKNQPVKVLGDGEISVKITVVDADRVSQSAKSKIEAAGGSVNQG